MKDNKQELIFDNNSICYLVVNIPKNVESAEDFAQEINSIKVDDVLSLKWLITNMGSCHRTKDEAEYSSRHTCGSVENCVVKINLPYIEFVRLWSKSTQDVKGNNYSKILNSMVAPSAKDLGCYLYYRERGYFTDQISGNKRKLPDVDDKKNSLLNQFNPLFNQKRNKVRKTSEQSSIMSSTSIKKTP